MISSFSSHKKRTLSSLPSQALPVTGLRTWFLFDGSDHLCTEGSNHRGSSLSLSPRCFIHPNYVPFSGCTLIVHSLHGRVYVPFVCAL